MDKMTVACVQMRMRLASSVDEYRDDLRRYMRAADAKRARVVLFPELAGLMVAPLLLRDRGSRWLVAAERSRRRNAGLWERLQGRLAGWAAGITKADLYTSIAALIDVDPAALWAIYAEIYGGLARSHGVTIVAPSGYLPGPDGGAIENRCAVFGPNGELLGTQSKVLGYSDEEHFPRRGSGWQCIPTEVGMAGVVLGSDILYPEVGRLLASQGADFLLVQAASPTPAFYNKMRAGTLARMQDNQLYAALALLVGTSPLRTARLDAGEAASAPTYAGRSAIFAPQELTPRSNGVLVEMGAGQGEGVMTAEWDFVALHELWESSDTPLRKPLPAQDAALLAGALHAQLRALPQRPQSELLLDAPQPDEALLVEGEAGADAGSVDEMPAGEPSALPPSSPVESVEAPADASVAERQTTRSTLAPRRASSASSGAAPAFTASGRTAARHEEDPVQLDALTVVASVTSRWPLRSAQGELPPVGEETVEWPARRNSAPAPASQIRREDETDEMDAVESGRAPGAQPAVGAASEHAPASEESSTDEPASDEPTAARPAADQVQDDADPGRF
jgi:predicted amidohydrolase